MRAPKERATNQVDSCSSLKWRQCCGPVSDSALACRRPEMNGTANVKMLARFQTKAIMTPLTLSCMGMCGQNFRYIAEGGVGVAHGQQTRSRQFSSHRKRLELTICDILQLL